MNNIRVLIRHNTKWGLEIVNQGKSVILTNASLPPLCFLRLKAAGFISVFIIILSRKFSLKLLRKSSAAARHENSRQSEL
jgi:hypothetical protein